MIFSFVIVAVLVFFVNIPFGYWRSNVKKFSLQWVLAIHLPVPFVIIMRESFQLGYHWSRYPLMIMAFFGGQFAGKKIYSFLLCRLEKMPGSCLVMDLVRSKKKV